MRIYQHLKPRQIYILMILGVGSVVAFILSLLFGAFSIPVLNMLSGNATTLQIEILSQIRGPRVILTIFVGAALGISGAALQGLFRNPLADPGLIGVSAGAALGAVLAIIFSSNLLSKISLGVYAVPLSATVGAGVVIALLFFLTRGFTQAGVTYMLLVGIAVNALATVGIGLLTFISTDSQLRGLTFWLMGSFGGARWSLIIPAILIISFAIGCMLVYSRRLDLMQLGENEARRLGVNVRRVKIMIILSAAFMIGASVSLSGIIGFVGLVVPHLVRLIGGPNHAYLLAGSALLGGGIMMLADLTSRIVIQPAELPVGLATSALGAPFFLWLVLRMKKS